MHNINTIVLVPLFSAIGARTGGDVAYLPNRSVSVDSGG